MSYDTAVRIKIFGDDSDFQKAINSTEASLNSLKGLLAKLGLASSLGAVIKSAITSTNEFEDALASASTLFGDVAVNTDILKNKIIALSKETGQSVTAITTALYQAESSGVEVTENMSVAMDFMEQATKLSVAGFTSVSSAVDSLAKIQNAYGKEVLSTEQISKNLVMTQNLGITTVDQLSQSLANVTPAASAFGVSLENIGASLSVMTKAGTDTSTATTQLNMLISSLAKTDTEASKNLKKATKEITGQEKSFQDLIAEGKNLQEILGYMKTYADNAGMSIVDLFTEMNAGKGALQIVSDSTQTFTEYLKQMTSEADIVQETYDKVMNTRSRSWGKLANRLKNITIKVTQAEGTQALLDSVYELAEDVVDKLEEWTPAISRALTSVTVGGGILFAYLKKNIENIPRWIAEALVTKSLLSSVTSALGLSSLSRGALGLSIALEIVDGLDGTKTWEAVGSELLSALATGLTIGSFLGGNAGALAMSIQISLGYDLGDLGEKLGGEFDKMFSEIGTAFGSIFDPKNEYSLSVKSGFQKTFAALGVIADNCFTGIGNSLSQLFEGDVLGAIKSALYQGMQMSAELLDIWDGGDTGTKHLDQFKVYKARNETPSASKFNDTVLLQYIKDAEAKKVDLEDYLQDVLSAVKAFEAENPLTSIVEDEKPAITQVMEEAIAEGIDLGTDEGLNLLEQKLKESDTKDKFSLNVGLGAFTNNLGIDPNQLVNEEQKALVSVRKELLDLWKTEVGRNAIKGIYLGFKKEELQNIGLEAGQVLLSAVKDVLGIHSPSKEFQEIGKQSVAGLEKGVSDDTIYKTGANAGRIFKEGTEESLNASTFEEIGALVTEGLASGMTEESLENLKSSLNTAYQKLGEDITTWLTDGIKNGIEYTITDAIADFLDATKLYNSLGNQIEGITVTETPATSQNNETGTSTSTDTSDQEEKVSLLQKAWDWLNGTIGDTQKTGFDAVNAIYEQFGNLNGYITQAISNSYDSQISALEEARDNAKKYNELSIEEEKEYDSKIKALKKEQFEKQKKANIATAVMDGALAIMNIIKEWAGNLPMQIALSAIASATTAAQIASISSQQSGYESGGLIGGHGYTGDKQQIWANAGELILNRAQQRTIADQLSYGGNTTVIQVEFSGNVFGDQQAVAEYVYDAIKTAQSQGVIRAW